MEHFWGQFTIEVIGGTVSAFIFLFIVLWLFKPRVKISPFLCRVVPQGGAQAFYAFKFINKSYFSAHEIKIELHKLRRIPMGGGLYNNEYEKLTMVNPEIPKLPGRPFRRRNQSNPDCIIFKSLEPISDILGDEFHAIALRVSLKHGLTGLSNVFEQEYANIEDIRTGRYKPGTKFETI